MHRLLLGSCAVSPGLLPDVPVCAVLDPVDTRHLPCTPSLGGLYLTCSWALRSRNHCGADRVRTASMSSMGGSRGLAVHSTEVTVSLGKFESKAWIESLNWLPAFNFQSYTCVVLWVYFNFLSLRFFVYKTCRIHTLQTSLEAEEDNI